MVIVGGNGLNRKSSFFVTVMEPPTDKGNEVTEYPDTFMANVLEDEPQRDYPR